MALDAIAADVVEKRFTHYRKTSVISLYLHEWVSNGRKCQKQSSSDQTTVRELIDTPIRANEMEALAISMLPGNCPGSSF